MNGRFQDFPPRYVAALQDHLDKGHETSLQQAYELGRNAIAEGLGVLDMAKLHQGALVSLLPTVLTLGARKQTVKAAEQFFLETLSPFEAAHRGFREANLRLRQLNETLEQRNRDLARMNQELESEIGARKRMEEMWKRYESIVNTSKDFLTLIDARFRYAAVNDAYCHAHGRSREQIIGRSVAAVWGRKVFNRVIQDNLQRCFAGHDVHYQTHFEFPAAGRRHFEVSYYPYHRDGKVTHAIVVTRDITERKRAEEALRDSEERYRLLVEGVRDYAIFMLDPRGYVASWNAGAERLKGYQAGEVVGRHFSCFYPEEAQRRGLPETQLKIARAAGRYEDESWRIRKDGSRFLANVVITPVRDRAGHLRGFSKLTRDITERRRAEDQLRASEERYRTLVETAKDVIFNLSADGRITSLNRAFETLTGWRRAKWLGKPFAPLLHPDDLTGAVERFKAILEGKTPTFREYRIRRRGGGYVVGEFTMTPQIKEGRPVGVFGIARDVTQRKQAEEALRQSEEHYRQLFQEACLMQERLRDLSDKILHAQEAERKRISRELHDEVGQALTAINMNLAMFRLGAGLNGRRLRKTIAETQGLLEQTMETVHHFARELRPAMLDDLGLVPALRSYANSFAERTGIHVRLRLDRVAEDLNSEQKTVIYRVTQESLNNVAKHAQATAVDLSVRKVKAGVRLEIHDNGKAFEVEQQLAAKKNKRLGLLGMQERVRLVNGEFAIDSQPNRGTLIRVQLPLKPGLSPTPAHQRSAAPNPITSPR